MRLKDRTVIVTGGGRGLGKVYAKAIAAEGGRVAVADIIDGEGAAREIRDSGGEAIYVRADVSDESSVNAMVEATVARFGGVYGLVNNAAICAEVEYRPIDQITVAEWDRVMAVNVKGVWLVAKAVYPHMKAKGAGKIVNITSVVPFFGYPAIPHYTVSKGAVVTLTKVLARAMGKDGICVNAIGPSLTRSESMSSIRGAAFDEEEAPLLGMRCIARAQYPEDIVGAVLFFLSDESNFILGQTLIVDGGLYMH
ncbi:MAG: SDR family NAD(P)-dependent oxidoreductase, partial [Alphaproteobacteria bacterium]